MSTGRYHWSNVSGEAKFFIINASASVPWLALILFPRWTTLAIALILTAFLLYVQFKKMNFRTFLKSKKTFFLGHSIRVERPFKGQ
ncbi:MAG: IcmT/TraK family protein [Giesbergeria sp.]